MALGQTTRPWKYADPKSKHLCGKIGGSDALHTTDTTLQKRLPLEQMTLNSLRNIACCYFGSDATILHQIIQLCGVGARASSFSLPSSSLPLFPPSSPFLPRYSVSPASPNFRQFLKGRRASSLQLLTSSCCVFSSLWARAVPLHCFLRPHSRGLRHIAPEPAVLRILPRMMARVSFSKAIRNGYAMRQTYPTLCL